MYELTRFVVGWRGFLVGRRRDWHAHHRGGVSGFRGGVLVARRAVQHGQLRAATALLADVFARGGFAWVFGSGVRSDRGWGRVRPGWRPGALSNYFFARLKRSHFARRLGRVLQPGRRRRRRTELATRWLRLRTDGAGSFPSRRGAVAAAYLRLTSGAAGVETGYTCSPRAGRLRSRWYRGWHSFARAFPVARFGRHPAGTPARKVIPRAARVVRAVQARRTGTTRVVFRQRRPGGAGLRASHPVVSGRVVPHRRVGRHQRWPLAFPSVLVASGLTLLGSTLLNEVDSAGLPFVRFGGVDLNPRTALFEVYWNGSAPAGAGLPGWLDDLFVRSTRAGLFRTCWRRLARLAER